MTSSNNSISSDLIIGLWIAVSIFILIAIVSFILSFIFYKKRKNDYQVNRELTPISVFDSPSLKIKSWWVKYRTSGCFCLGVLFVMLSIGGIIFVVNL